MNDEQKRQKKERTSNPKDNFSRKIFYIVLIFAIIGIFAVGFVVFSKHEDNQNIPVAVENPGALPGLQLGDAPWAAELIHLRERLVVIGLPALHEEGSAVHIHQHLDIYIHGKPTMVPPGIGFNPMERFISPVHTHDGNGIIHIESPAVQKFTLGQFFDIWGVRFNSNCIGSYCQDQNNLLKTFINGIAQNGDPRSIGLSDHQVIVIVFGNKSELPNPIPSQYQFPQGT